MQPHSQDCTELRQPATKAGYLSARSPIWLLLFTAIFAGAFVNKAFHIDDPLFLATANHIQGQPADFYNFSMNWNGNSRPMFENFQNPPLASYYLAPVAAVTGWSEIALHLAFLLPALAAAWGMFELARLFCERPVVAATLAVITPAFLISATNLMCDVMLVTFWVWALVWFEKGIRRNGGAAFITAGILAGLAFTTKFVGAALIPLFAVYGACRLRKLGYWLTAILLPVIFIIGYELVTRKLYGRGHLFDAAGISSHAHLSSGGFWERQILGLSYLGGCMLPMMFMAPLIWSSRSIVWGLIAIAPGLLIYPYFGAYTVLWNAAGSPNWWVCFQSALFIISAVHVLILAISDFRREKSNQSLLLLLWVIGIFVFATMFNWTLNGRSILPMVPAVGILAARRLQLAPTPSVRTSSAWLWPAVVSAALTFLLTQADYALANTGRLAAAQLCARYQQPAKTLWFEGHWGFQYYMQERGAKPLEVGTLEPDAGDIIIVPSQAVNTFDLPTNLVRLVEAVEYTPNSVFATMNRPVGAGFYAATAGPFPYSTGNIDPERYYVFEVTKPRGSDPFRMSNPFLLGAVAEQCAIDRVMRALKEKIHSSPEHAAAHYHLGRCFNLRKKPDLAAKEFLETLRLEPTNQSAQAELARLVPQEAIAREPSVATVGRRD